ncbi:unnamed protein product [Linum tenue]|uniref:Reverse transcriptase domain-containing protein n=1 Tax=Linum tenue TaxID=586396 RepID=A0AAV0QD44_9ROSI|nr:unnamed protein product [Linum tenue]
MGEGVECGKVSHEHMVVNGIEGQGTEDKGKEKVMESGSPPIASHAGGFGVVADSQAVVSSYGVLVANSQVVASSSEVGGKIAANTSTPAREDLIDAYGFQLVVRKGKNVSVGREQSSEMRILASAIQSRVPLNSKGVAMVIPVSPKKGGRKNKKVEYFAELLVNKLIEEEAACLTLPVTREEIKHVFFSMGRDKAPGPNGFVAEFFKLDWEVVGVKCGEHCSGILQNGVMPKQVNSTVIALIPKLPVVEKMKDFRPISCCNVIYKGISKLLSRRLSTVLPKLIGRSQSAFVKGRLISDNILMATELVKDYHRSRISSRCALKIDLMKAFDSVNWNFLFTVMSAMGMPSSYVKLVESCISTPMLSVSFNGGLCRYFPAAKGLRQGDPLSPYLFTIAVFGIQQVLNKFYEVSGLKSNPQKCQLFCAGSRKMKIKYYLLILGFLWRSYMFDIWECRFCQVN